jgi:hypothetical protein
MRVVSSLSSTSSCGITETPTARATRAVALVDAQHYPGRLQPQRNGEWRDDDASGAEHGAERDDAREVGGELAQVAVGLDEALSDGRRVGEQPAPGIRQVDAQRAGPLCHSGQPSGDVCPAECSWTS